MIQINLLEQSSKRKSSRRTGGRPGESPLTAADSGVRRGLSPLVLVLALVMAVLNAGAGWWCYNQWHDSFVRYSEVKAKHTRMKNERDKKLADADQVRQFREVVANQMDVLRSLDPPNRILWSEKVNMLSNLIPPNVFLSDIEIVENVEMVETDQSKGARAKWEKADAQKRGKQPEVVTRPVITYTMRITGLALGQDNVEQFNNVLNFHKAMADYKLVDAAKVEHRFMDGFSPNIDFEAVQATEYQSAAVNKFIFRLKTRPMGDEEKKPQAPTGRTQQIAAARPTRATASPLARSAANE